MEKDPEFIDQLIHGDSEDDLVNNMKFMFLVHRGVSRILAHDLVYGVHKDKYDEYAGRIEKGLYEPEKTVFKEKTGESHKELYDEEKGDRWMELGIPRHGARLDVATMDEDQHAMMVMAMKAGYDYDEARKLAMETDPDSLTSQIMMDISKTSGKRLKRDTRNSDEVLRERLEYLRKDDALERVKGVLLKTKQITMFFYFPRK